MKYTLEGVETERLKFRLLEDRDFDEWMVLFVDHEISRMFGMANIKTPKERCKQWFDWTYNRYENNLGGQNVLINKSNNKIIGQSGLLIRTIDGIEEMEVAYSILPSSRKMGFATEASKKCRDHAFENKFSHRLISIINIDNLNSEKVALKNGMKKDRIIEFGGNPSHIFQITIDKWHKIQEQQL